MLEEEGVVVSVAKGMAEVSVKPRSACGSCAASNGCGTSLIASLFPRRGNRFRVRNTVGARTGEAVTVGLHESALQSASLMLYLTPLAGLILGAMGGIHLSERFFSGSSELLSIMLGFTGMGAGLVLVRYWVQRTLGPGACQAEIICIKKQEKSGSGGPQVTLVSSKSTD